MLPTDTRLCGTGCRVANAVMAVRAACSLPAESEGVPALLDAVRDRLDEVLHEVVNGRYVPSMIDAMAALEFARERAGSECLASELAPLMQVGIAAMNERLKADRLAPGSVTLSRAARVNLRVH